MPLDPSASTHIMNASYQQTHAPHGFASTSPRSLVSEASVERDRDDVEEKRGFRSNIDREDDWGSDGEDEKVRVKVRHIDCDYIDVGETDGR